MHSFPVITGMGLVTPLATGLDQNWSALVAGRYITTHARVGIELEENVARVDALALLSAREAIRNAGWNDFGDDVGLVVGTSKGAANEWMNPLLHMDTQTYIVGGLGATAEFVARELGFGCGPRLTLSAACASGLHAIVRGCLMLRAGEARRVLVVASEASIHPLFVGSFKRLKVLPREEVGCRPFDLRREGFVMSEAAAAVCLEKCERRGVVVEQLELGADATHLTGSDPDGIMIRRMLHRVTHGRPVDLVHAHATGTEAHDPIELAAIDDECGQGRPNVYSHKGTIGHSLGAAGLVAVVLSVMMHERGIVLPNVRTEQALPCRRVRIDRDSCEREIRRSVVLAAGFGGAMGALSLISR